MMLSISKRMIHRIDTHLGIFFRNGEVIGSTTYSNIIAKNPQRMEIKILMYGPMDKGMLS